LALGPQAVAAPPRLACDPVGTQLGTKGYRFPNLTLVGVVDADLGWRAAICARPGALRVATAFKACCNSPRYPTLRNKTLSLRHPARPALARIAPSRLLTLWSLALR